MPYFLHTKDTEPESGMPYATAKDAHQACNPKVQKITFIATDDERYTWQARERLRFTSASPTIKYIHVPWHDIDRYPDHFVHLSTIHKDLIAYTASDEHGVADRQTRVRPGKYLQEFYASKWNKDRIDKYIGECGATHLTLSIATTADEIEQVYSGGRIGSCMHKFGTGADPEDENSFDSSIMPVRAYGNSDLAVAYLGPIEAVTARAVVWPEKKYWSRLYGNEGVLRATLESAGYSKGSLSGAKIRVIREAGKYVVPYIDYIECGRLSGEYIILGSGSVSLQSTSGLVRACDDDEDETTDCRYCSQCGDPYDYDCYGSNYCETCLANHWSCQSCPGDFFDTNGATLCADGGYVCEACTEDDALTCDIDDCGNTWIEAAEFNYRERRARQLLHMATLCRSCAGNHACCSMCNAYYLTADHTACPTCQQARRCQHTSTLPVAEDTQRIVSVGVGDRYIRRTQGEYVPETNHAWCVLGSTGTLRVMQKDGTMIDAPSDWQNSYSHYLNSGSWEYFTPTLDQPYPLLAYYVRPTIDPTVNRHTEYVRYTSGEWEGDVVWIEIFSDGSVGYRNKNGTLESTSLTVWNRDKVQRHIGSGWEYFTPVPQSSYPLLAHYAGTDSPPYVHAACNRSTTHHTIGTEVSL